MYQDLIDDLRELAASGVLSNRYLSTIEDAIEALEQEQEDKK